MRLINEIIYNRIGRIPLLRKLIVIIRRKVGFRFITAPHVHLKQSIVKKYAKKFEIKVLIETGTCDGGMLYATRKNFERIFSIEIDEYLHNLSKERLAKYRHISLYKGDSSRVLPEILSRIDKPCLFWLDAHYSGGITAKGSLETPIMSELKHILNHSNLDHVILIDDAVMFVGKNDYPKLEEVREFITNERPHWTVYVNHDIIRIHKKV